MEYLELSVSKAPDCLGLEIEKWTRLMQSGEVLLLENLRFHKEEEENDEIFAKGLAKLGDIYVNEAFSVSHRSHASVVGIAKILPSCAGFQLEKEIKILGGILENPKKPLVVVIGGKKVEDKTGVINRISEIADFILVSGLIEKEIKEKNLEFSHPEKIIGPVDETGEGRDIGPKTVELFAEKINRAKTVFWSGPLGAIEQEEFCFGSRGIAQAIVKSGAFSAVGGGDTAEFVGRIGLAEKFNHLSLGGGAMLKFLGGKELPGLKVLG
jgi:phosphoglycerate kinase